MESKITLSKNSDEVKNNSINVQKSETSFTSPLGNWPSFGNKSQDANVKEPSTNILKLDKTAKEQIKEKNVETKSQIFSSEESKNTVKDTNGFKFGDFKLNNQSLSTSATSKSPEFKFTNKSPEFKFTNKSPEVKFTSKSPEFKFIDKKQPSVDKPTVCKTLNTKPPFNFGSTLPSFSFKSSEQNDVKPLFSFGSKSPTLTFSPEKLKTEILNSKEEDEDQPPTVKFTPVKEKNAIFESKSKLFCFKEGKYEELGVGQLYLIPVDKKLQLIMRNDNALGTIMANTLLNESVNFTKRNAKNVQLTCILDPTKSTKPQTILFKFKDSEITDSFEKELTTLKK
jgi:hypothetical protein